MEKETFELIRKLLNCEVDIKKNRMMDCINNGFDAFIKERINEYREVFYARDDFLEWAEDQDFECLADSEVNNG